LWIRFVLVPGLTDAPHNVRGIAEFVSRLPSVKRVDILPFHKMGEFKWQQLGRSYQLGDTQPPSEEQIESAREEFRKRGLNVH
jgi:pyruvate formate lyase activating enzyme